MGTPKRSPEPALAPVSRGPWAVLYARIRADTKAELDGLAEQSGLSLAQVVGMILDRAVGFTPGPSQLEQLLDERSGR